MFSLYCTEGPLQGQKIEVPAGDIITLGRQEGNHIVFDSPRVSRKHFEFLQQGNFLYLKDLGSQNGVYLNGKRVESAPLQLAVELKPGDEISFGDYIFKLEQNSSPPSSSGQPEPPNPPYIPVRSSDIDNKAHLAILYGAYRALAQSKKEEEFRENIALLIIKIFKAERVCLMTYNAKKNTFLPSYFATLSELGKKAHFEPSMMVLHQILNHPKTVFTVDAGSDKRFKDGQSIVDPGVRSIICTPLIQNQEMMGAIYVDTLQSENSFGEEEKQKLEALADLIVTAKTKF